MVPHAQSSARRHKLRTARRSTHTKLVAEHLEVRLTPATGSISGVAYNDLNANGVQDASEPGIAGQTVFIDLHQDGTLDPGDPTTTTASDGSYQFTGLQPGTYLVSQVLPSGWHQTTPKPTLERAVSVIASAPYTFTFANFASTTDQTIPAYTENGFVFNTTAQPTSQFTIYGSSDSTRYAGEPALSAEWSPSTISLMRSDGTPFTLDAMDLSTIWSSVYTVTVTFTGHLAGGGTVTQAFNIGSQLGFHHVTFNGFTNVQYVTWNSTGYNDYHQFTNVTVETGGPLNVSGVNFGSVNTGADAPPSGASPTYIVNENSPLTVANTGALTNAFDPDKDPLSAILVSGPANGTLTLSPLGPFTYTPNANFYGTDSFQYEVSDGTELSAPATVTINVQKVEYAPTAVADTYSVTKSTPLTVSAAAGVLANDSDVNGDPLTAILENNPAHGSLKLNADGSFTYTPFGVYLGPDTFEYKASNGTLSSNVVVVTLNVTGPDDPPVANNHSYTVAENTVLQSNAPGVLFGDSDPNGQPITAVLISGPSNGTLQLNANGSYTYTPNANFYGTDSFQYTDNDGQLNGNTATVTITVDSPPVAVPESFSTTEDVPLTVAAPGVLANDTQAAGNPLTADLWTLPAHGTIKWNGDGSFVYTPNLHYYGTDSFQYLASDGKLDSAVVTDTVNIAFVNYPPVANNDQYTMNEGTSLTTVAAVTSLNIQSQQGDYIGGGQNYSYGANDGTYTVTRNYSNGVSIRFVPNVNPIDSWQIDFAGPNNALLTPGTYDNAVRYPFQSGGEPGLSVSYYDRGSNTLTGQFTIYQATYDASGNVISFNASFLMHNEGLPPALSGQIEYNAFAGQTGVLFNDTDIEHDPLTAQLVTGPSNGSLTFNSDGTFTYTPSPLFYGTDSFTYQANDGTSLGNVATATITVAHVNHPPTAVIDNYAVGENQTLSVAGPGVLANDTDLDNDPLTAVLVAGPTNGSLTLNSDGSFAYTPNAGFVGTDTFQYEGNDGQANSNVVTDTITVDAPAIAANATVAVAANTPAAITLSASDPENSPLTYTVVAGPSHGTLSGTGANLTYTPDSDYVGSDTFTFQANDGVSDSNVATVTLGVVGTPTIAWASPADITYGTALGAAQLDASATFGGLNVPGTFVYTPAAGTVLSAGANQPLSVTFTPDDTTDYNSVTASTTINVLKASPSLTWANPADITYGTALSSTQLDATASVPGTISYTPAAGTVLGAGQGQTLSATFTPTDTTDYNTVTGTATINVLKANPTLVWGDGTHFQITYGTPLSAAQLDASASFGGAPLAGTFTYVPAAGTILNAGVGQILSTRFKPTDSADFNDASASALIDVAQATPTFDSLAAPTIVYGTTTHVSGHIAAGTLVPTGMVKITIGNQTAGAEIDPSTGDFAADVATANLGASSTPYTITYSYAGSTNFTAVSATTGLTVNKANQTISWSNPAAITYGTPLSSTQLDATVSVSGPDQTTGALTYSPAAGTVLSAGPNQTLTVTAAATANYNAATRTVTISVAPATPVITWASPAGITYGTALSSTQLDATASVPGTFSYSPAAGTVLTAGQGQVLTVTFTPTDSTDYSTVSASTTIDVAKAHLTVTANNADMGHGDPVPTLTASISGFVNGDTSQAVSGSAALSTTATSTSAAGTYPITASIGTLSAANYDFAFVPGTLTVHPKVLDIRVHWGTQTMSLLGLTRDLPFININAVDVLFSDDVTVGKSDLSLSSTTGRAYTFSGFSYNATQHDATWTLPTALGIDQLLLALDSNFGANVNPSISVWNNNPLSFTVLPGDFNGDRQVTRADWQGVQADVGMNVVWADLDGNGVVNRQDVNDAKSLVGTSITGGSTSHKHSHGNGHGN